MRAILSIEEVTAEVRSHESDYGSVEFVYKPQCWESCSLVISGITDDMKLLTVALVSALAVCVKGDLEAMMALAKECKEKVGATSEDLAKLKTEGVPVTKEQKCFMSCILTAEKLVSFVQTWTNKFNRLVNR